MINIDLNKIWKDPVWSKVIAAGLIFILSQLFIFIWGWISNLNFIEAYQKLYKLLISDYLIKGWFILLSLIAIAWALIFVVFKLRTNGKRKAIQLLDIPKTVEENKEFPINEAPTVFFHYRFCDAFPGFDSGYRWFTSSNDINNRLKILLSHPTKFNKGEGHGIVTDPIWWFRGSSALFIQNFEVLSRKKVLLNIDELKIEKIAAYRGRSYFEDFVYVQCLPDRPTGLYNHNQLTLKSYFDDYKEYHEEFGIYKNKLISRQEYDDGSALIRGKPVKVEGAKLRTRNLTKYNFIIAAKFSPYNCDEFNRNSEDYFIQLLKGEINFDSFVTWMKKFPKNINDY
ncbi:MAG: hypothetical protein WC868_07885 [Bacteroidales bacterium]